METDIESLTEMLIDLVKHRPEIYDKNHELYFNRVHLRRMWDEIADELGVDAETARRKWTFTRDYFQKQRRLRQSSFVSKRPKWYLYKRLTFLEDHVSTRTDAYNYKGGNANQESHQGDEENDDETRTEYEALLKKELQDAGDNNQGHDDDDDCSKVSAYRRRNGDAADTNEEDDCSSRASPSPTRSSQRRAHLASLARQMPGRSFSEIESDERCRQLRGEKRKRSSPSSQQLISMFGDDEDELDGAKDGSVLDASEARRREPKDGSVLDAPEVRRREPKDGMTSVDAGCLSAVRDIIELVQHTPAAPEDEDELFFKSLVPRMKMLDPTTKLECQGEIISLVLRFLKQAKSNPPLS